MTFKWAGTYKPKIVEGPYKPKRSNRLLRLVMMATILLVLVCLAISIIFTYHVVSYDEPCTYTVKRGDTLWAIAKATYGEKVDVRKIVYRMMDLNGIDDPGQLQPGQQIYLPVVD